MPRVCAHSGPLGHRKQFSSIVVIHLDVLITTVLIHQSLHKYYLSVLFFSLRTLTSHCFLSVFDLSPQLAVHLQGSFFVDYTYHVLTLIRSLLNYNLQVWHISNNSHLPPQQKKKKKEWQPSTSSDHLRQRVLIPIHEFIAELY